MPTGWRPQDVAEKYPRKPTDCKQQVKYNPPTSTFTKGWAMFQLLGTTFLLLTLFASFGSLSYTSIRDMGMLLFVSVFAYTSIMDGTRYARIILMVYPLLGMLYIYSLGTELYLESPLLYYGALGYWLATWFSNPLLWRYSQPSISQTIDGFQT